jgi:peptide chain release factor 2
MYEEAARAVDDYRQRLGALRACLKVDAARARIEVLEAQMSSTGFWDDSEAAQKVVLELKALKASITAPDTLERELQDFGDFVAMAQEENDESFGDEIEAAREKLEKQLHQIELASLFTDPRDTKPALVSVHPGAGGTESCDWASMLYRMITRYCDYQGFVVEVLDYQDGDEAGLKSATLRVTGPNAYGKLKSENGVHRLVRISPYDSAARRHTSFTAVEVINEIDDDINIEVREDDLKMDVFRSSGAGGQKVNKTSSAVRLTHLPTGIVVSCQIERSQHRNRDTALNMLKSKLYDIEQRRLADELASQRDGQKDVAWGSQIRSYVLHPYQMVKDHRTGCETGNIQKVLDGDLDDFVEAYLKWKLDARSGAAAPS